jgi:tetratricopeptide (TPR) repeat protein/KaiC/GvpD/RAD55 family RecA-like ATPase
LSSLEHLQNGRYVILKKLGEGGKGTVYKARDTALNRVVAIKMLKTVVSGEEAYSRFLREAQAVAKLNHPNIVSIYDIGREDEKQFFVLEFVDGMSLRELNRTYPEGECDVQTVLRTAIDVCGGLQYAHSQGILHLDVKPENILITQDGTAKLMDFGLAKMLGEPGLMKEGIMVGTVAYVAPEIALGKSADARSDLYSLGAVLYEMVTGRPPFPSEDPVKIIFGHIHDHPVSPSKLNPNVPQALADCIMKLLEKEPAKRYQSAADLLAVLRDVTEGFLREVYMPSRKPLVVPSSRPPALREIQLIDRVDELGLLREAVDKAVHGEGGVVFLYGEAGIGKTRLARELGAYARLRGMQVLYGRCPALFRMDGVPPYVLWREAIRNYLEVCTPEQLYKVIGFYPSEVSKLVPEVRQKLGAFPQSLPISPEHERDRLFEAVSQFVTNISKEAPLLVVLDDLQWTDQSSLLLLHYLARGVYRESMLIFGAYRDTDVDEKHPLSPVLTELNRERLLRSVQLKRMSFDDVVEMIRRILEQDDVPMEFCKLVYEKTRGNPFFVEEVIKSLEEEGVIYQEEGKCKIKEISSIEFPKTIKSVIKTRISRLDDECQTVLTLASFVGNDFGFEALREVTGFEEDKLLELMDRMLKTGLIKERVIRGESVCSFADVIYRDVLHEEVSPFRHKKLHGVVGCALEKVYAKKIDEHFGELALHFLESGDTEKALDYFLKAGEKAAKVYANTEAASYYQSALRLLEETEGALREKGHVLERLGDIKGLVGEHDACMKYWNEALLLWRQLYEKENVSRLHRKIANVLWDAMGDTKKAEEHYDQALKILEASPESVELASLYQNMARMYYRTKDMTKALSWAEKAIELAKKLNAYEIIASSYASLGTIFSWTGDLEKGIECHERALKIALDNGYTETALLVYNNLAMALPAEEHDRIKEYLEEGLELAKKVGDIVHQSWICENLAGSYSGMGDVKKAVLLVEESVALDRKTGNMPHLCMSLGGLGIYSSMLGEWDKSERYLGEAVSISQRLNDWQSIGYTQGWLGWHHMLKAEYAKARELFEKSVEIYEKAGAKYPQMFGSQYLSWVYIELGEIEKANNLINSSYEFALKAKDKQLIANTDALKGMLFRAQKRWEESIEHFEKSLQQWEALAGRRWYLYWFAKFVLFEYARVYIERDQEGDREKAHSLLNQALEIFRKLGAKKDTEKTESKIVYAETGLQKVSKSISAAAPSKAPSLITTGYSDLDNMLFGGMPQDYAVILTSPSCDERDLLVKSFLEMGARNDEVTFYVTTDPGPVKTLAEEFPSSFYLFVCNPQADAIVKSLPNVVKLKGVENITDISIALTSVIRKLNTSQKRHRRVCIGLISDVLLQHHAVQTRRWLTGLITELRSKGFTTLAIMDPEMHPPQEVRAVLDLFEGEINIFEKGLGKYLKIKKMSNHKYLESELLLEKRERK